MSDYFLSKVYDSLLRRKQPVVKSAFRTLSESYNLVYEEEQEQQKDILFDVNKYQQGKWTQAQGNLYNTHTAGYSSPDPLTQATGVGPGEYAVASLISGATDFNECAKLVSGQSLSFDVSWPSADNPKYKFEVKKVNKLDDVRIGTKGADLGKKVTNTVIDALNSLKDEYDMLLPDDKEQVNKKVKKYLEDFGFKTKGEKEETRLSRLTLYTEWELDKYINAIIKKSGELPFGMIFNELYSYKSNKKNPERTKYVKLSIYKLIQLIEQINIEDTKDKEEENKETDTEEVVKDVFYKVYGGEAPPTFNQFLDKEAHKVDRKIIKQKIDITQKGGINLNSFVKSIKKFKLLDKLNELKNDLTDSKNITSLFPEDLKGLFIVDKDNPKHPEWDWIYIPSAEKGKYIEITRITQDKPKIKLKHEKDYSSTEDANI
jgi:hypothetical protein